MRTHNAPASRPQTIASALHARVPSAEFLDRFAALRQDVLAHATTRSATRKNLAVGPVAAVVDRARDVVRKAMG
ncbi:hypothetical protein [Streptomyces sp. HGB0020]|uniref:hypothetical protein n=1 Tax=Streptomyces sp. HGB0020 TaxID=1078086 RepID=UPI0003A1B746|nr:hypothetical protein [Streptomyces sp. HGB0020]